MERSVRSEKGIGILLLAISLSCVLLLVSAGLTISYYWLVRAQMRSASDATVLAAASLLGGIDPSASTGQSASGAWSSSLSTAVEVINSQLRQNLLGFPRNFQLDSGLGPHWTTTNFEIDIERGRWVDETFSSFEEDWQRLHPGIPAAVAANAVRVRMRIPALVPLLSWFGAPSLPVEVHSVALARANRPVRAAPFAIPVCSLLNNQGEFLTSKLCIADRLITGAQRYCTATNPNCNIVPDFSWDPFLPSSASGVWPYPIIVSPTQDNACFFASPHYPEAADNFGVFGLPGLAAPTEGLVQAALGGPTPGIEVSIGDPFMILPQGMTDAGSNSIVWRQIVNTAGAADDHVTFASSGLQGINQNKNIAFMSPQGLNRAASCSATNYSTTSPVALPRPLRPGWGTCNSLRQRWGNWTNPATPYHPPDVPISFSIGQVPVWQPMVAVIADPAGAGCQGIEGSSSDPAMQSDHPYEVIGFVKLNVYDVDIGQDPPSYPDPYGAYATGLTVNADYPWGFNAGRCNLVRTRLACDNSFVASSNPIGQGDPQLVE